MNSALSESPPDYDRRSIFLHWTTATLIAIQWLGAHTIDWAPRGALRIDVRSMHILIGVALAFIILFRVYWRLACADRPPAMDKGLLLWVSNAVYFTLYGLVLVTVALGFVNVWVRGDSLFGMFQIPKLGMGGQSFKEQIESLHGLCANAILVVAGVHASAALWHQYWLKDDLLRRMIPGLSPTTRR